MDWEPAEKVQKNDAGEFRAFIGGEWVPVAAAQKSDSGQYRVARQAAPAPVKIGKEGFSDALGGVIDDTGVVGRNLAGAGTALSNLWEGAKQMVGKGDDQAIQANRQLAAAAPVGAFAGNAALLAPTMAIPGANTVAGAGLVGAAQGLLTPTQGNESRLTNTAVGGALGAAGQFAGNKIGDFVQSRVANAAATRAADQSKNAVRDATLKAGQEAGYVLPPSAVQSSFLKNRLESIGGKAAVGQEAAARNQQATNALARKALGMSDDVPLSEGVLDAFRKEAAQPYREIAALPAMPPTRSMSNINPSRNPYPVIGPAQQAPAEALRDLQLARSQANDAWKEYSRTGVVTAKEAAESLSKKVQGLESYLEETAQAAGRNDLAAALKEARTKIAKSYEIERALNIGTGDISAPILGRAMDKGAPMTGELATIAKFQQAFPSYMREGEKIPTPGVSKSEALAAALLASIGGAAGGPAGMVAGALPLLSEPARKLALSKALQSTPKYTAPMTEKAMAQITPQRAAMLARALGITAPALAAE